MKRILIFLALLLAAYVSFSQSPIYGRLRVISGLYDNYFQNGTDTFKLGWRTDRFQLKYNTNKRFIDLIKSDSTVIIYNKLILTSPNDTMLSVRGMFSATSDSYINGLLIGRGGGNLVSNTAIGVTALNGNTTGQYNVALGNAALYTNSTANNNVAIGYYALLSTNATDNVGIGYYALKNNSTGLRNIAIGSLALEKSFGGHNNIAIGRASLNNHSAGDGNIGIGVNTLNLNVTGSSNMALGDFALWKATDSYNVAMGGGALQNVTTGSNNVGIGTNAGNGMTSNTNGNTLLGVNAGRSLTSTTSNNIFIGLSAGYHASQKVNAINTMALGESAYTTADNQYVYGNASVTEHNFRSGKVIMKYAADTTLSVRGTSRFNGGMFPQEHITLLNTTNSVHSGVIYKGANRFLHDFNYGNNGVVTTDGYNTFVGLNSGNLTMGATATNVRHSSYNVGLGFVSLTNNTTGKENTAIGSYSLGNNSTGYSCTGVGAWSLYENTTGNNNTVLGVGAGSLNKTGSNNLFLGYYAGYWGSEWNNKGFIDVIDRGDSASQLTSSPIVIDFNAVPTSQWITNNANVKVNEGSVLFTGTTGTTPASGAGTRLMWIPSKAAFRAGYVDDMQWDASNIGNYSFAIGEGSQATALYSFALSAGVASGTGSVAFPSGAAEGDYSISFGGGSAIGDKSVNFSDCISATYNTFSFGQYNEIISGSTTMWVSSDPLIQIGNGLADATRNDAFRVLKNGKTFIGDSSSVTDAILIVDPTDSTSAFIGNVSITDTVTMEHLTVTDSVTLETALFDIYHLAPDADSLVVADDGVINLRAGAYGELHVSVYNAGMYEEFAWAIINTDGSIGILIQNSTDVTTTGGTDGKLNIYDAGAYTTIENKLGGSRTIKYVFTH